MHHTLLQLLIQLMLHQTYQHQLQRVQVLLDIMYGIQLLVTVIHSMLPHVMQVLITIHILVFTQEVVVL